jgi:predicted NBD/HSP70 family sugar kinase
MPTGRAAPGNAETNGEIVFSHGAGRLVAVTVDTYNAELRDSEGFIGDRASRRAFDAIFNDARERLAKVAEDPLGDTASADISKKKLDKILASGDPDAAGLVHSAVEEFSQELAAVIRRFLRLKAWRGTQRIIVGGGLRTSRAAELAIGRASFILKADHGHDIQLRPIRHHPDEAGLIGGAHLAPSWIFAGHDSILAVDIGGTNIRVGLVELNLKTAPDLSSARVASSTLWRHRQEKPGRDEAVGRLGEMLLAQINLAKKNDHRLAPLISVGCPGIIAADGTITRGGQNLPGNWGSRSFNLPTRLRALIPTIGGNETMVVMHNDAVVQGLSEAPFMTDVAGWGVLTIGTGLGNARFTNRQLD